MFTGCRKSFHTQNDADIRRNKLRKIFDTIHLLYKYYLTLRKLDRPKLVKNSRVNLQLQRDDNEISSPNKTSQSLENQLLVSSDRPQSHRTKKKES